MKFYLTEEEHLILPNQKRWCGTLLGGWMNCCMVHDFMSYLLIFFIGFTMGRL